MYLSESLRTVLPRVILGVENLALWVPVVGEDEEAIGGAVIEGGAGGVHETHVCRKFGSKNEKVA